MYILGINAFHADVSACLLKDGQLIVALEEERFRRVKHWAGFPTLAIQKCLEIAGISGGELDHVAISRDPRAHLWRKALYVATHRPDPRIVIDRIGNARKFGGIKEPLGEALGIPVADLPHVNYVEHHPSHLASAFFVSPFEDATVCAIDGFGDFVSTSVAAGAGSQLKMLDRVFFPHSLGMIYTAVTQHLGFLGFGDEFKVMGLAPYGRPEFADKVRKLVQLEPRGKYRLNLKYFRHWKESVEMEWKNGYPSFGLIYSPELERLLGPARKADEPLLPQHEDLAASLQKVYEECAFHVLEGAWERTRNPRLCMAGGCAMNSVANGKIRSNTPFSDVYVQPASADNGTALGAAFHVWNQGLGHPRRFVMEHGYWGTSYPKADLTDALNALPNAESMFEWEECISDEETCRKTAKLLADGNVVGWCQGRMEWGARALGNRSILADPRRADMRELINTKIKFREKFRPFAPSILEEHLKDYFDNAVPDPFMLQVYPVREDKKAVLPAITHVDGSGRLQTVSQRTNPLYYHLIKEFHSLTGVPVVLNTSFNENEPIVDNPRQALDCFLRTKMDAIVVNRLIVRRRTNGDVGNVPPTRAGALPTD